MAERQQEIGVRMALGAEARRVRRMVVARGVRLVVIGVVLGRTAALGATRALDASGSGGPTLASGLTACAISHPSRRVGVVPAGTAPGR